MSTDATEPAQIEETPSGFPELSPLGKRIELLRISRGMTKQQLARGAGTSRQQLWRVMSGKSELTSSLGFRLAQVLRVDGGMLSTEPVSETFGLPLGAEPETTGAMRGLPAAAPASLAAFLADPAAVERTLASLPSDDLGRRIKRELLNAIEDVAGAQGLRLPSSFFELRGRVLNREL